MSLRSKKISQNRAANTNSLIDKYFKNVNVLTKKTNKLEVSGETSVKKSTDQDVKKTCHTLLPEFCDFDLKKVSITKENTKPVVIFGSCEKPKSSSSASPSSFFGPSKYKKVNKKEDDRPAGQVKLEDFKSQKEQERYKKLVDENQKHLERLNEFKKKNQNIIKNNDLIVSSSNSSDTEFEEKKSKNKIDNNSEDDDDPDMEHSQREEFIKNFEKLKRIPKYLPDNSSSFLSSVVVLSSQSSHDSDLYVVEDKSNSSMTDLEKTIKFAQNYINTIKLDNNNNEPAKAICLKKDMNMEFNILKTEKLNSLIDSQLQYLILREINYYLNIFTGYESSWRHDEFKKNSRKSSIELYSNVTFKIFKQDQFVYIVNLFQSLFLTNVKQNVNKNRYDDYIIKVLLPEALIKICMFMYDCDKENAEKYLQNSR